MTFDELLELAERIKKKAKLHYKNIALQDNTSKQYSLAQFC